MKRLSLRLDSEIYDNIKFIAISNRRSINNEIAFALSEYILTYLNKSGLGERDNRTGENSFFTDSVSPDKIGLMNIKKEKK
ncbi:MAG: Arc family DNA-binding protein [Leptospirales bacterium]